MTTRIKYSDELTFSVDWCPQAAFKGKDCRSLKQLLIDNGKENLICYFIDEIDEPVLALNGAECDYIVCLVQKFPSLKVAAFFDEFWENKMRKTTIMFSESYYDTFMDYRGVGLHDGQSDCPFSEEVDILSETEKIYKGVYSCNGNEFEIEYEFPFKKEWNRHVEEKTYLPLSEGETIIANSAFENNDSLMDVEISNKVKKIGKKAFCNCESLKKIVLPSGIKKIEDATFSSCNYLQNIVIPETVSNIGNSAFENCYRLKEVTFPERLEKIGSAAFSCCSELTNLVFPQGITKIGKKAFNRCRNIKEIEIPGGVKNIEAGAFGECWKLRKVILSEGVECIEKMAFKGCCDLEDITIPFSVTKITASAFRECFDLKKIVVPNPDAVIDGSIIKSIEVIRPGLED